MNQPFDLLLPDHQLFGRSLIRSQYSLSVCWCASTHGKSGFPRTTRYRTIVNILDLERIYSAESYSEENNLLFSNWSHDFVINFKINFASTTNLSILRYLGDYCFRHAVPYFFFFQQMMEGCDSTKIEVDCVHSSTDPLRDKCCRLNFCSCSQINNCLGGVSLNRHHHSSTDTSSIAITSYDFRPTSKLDSTLSPIAASTLRHTKTSIAQRSSTTTNQFPFQRLSVDSVCSYFESFSQSNACIAFGFAECRSYTMLDQL